jgi:transcriptional regulator with XRE-family HTH domain
MTKPESRFLSPDQCRAARALLHWTQEELARRARVAQATVRDFEAGRHRLHRSTETLIVTALVAAGVTLLGDPEAGFGVFRHFSDDGPLS